ncbi:MAG: beta-N-acetylhexosaminidase, partial [Bacteroidales bacterium]|nr:beta-N-acetylhexosaminidase [Bacteroidales bacterium]
MGKRTNSLSFILLLALLLFSGLRSGAAAMPSVSDTGWADSVLHQLTLEQKIAQLIMVRMHSNKDKRYNDTMVAQIHRHQVGGVCFFQSSPTMQAVLTNRIQAVSSIPVMVSIDGEWGLGMRLDSVMLYPRQMALGAGRDTANIYLMGRQMALQCRRIGVHVNFAPDVDINNNSNNPVINSRSFGSDPELVIRCALAYMKGMQDNGVMATAKHFPGHGDTETDSHKATPSILHSRRHLEKMELRPFQAMIDAGVDGMMIGHLMI